MCDQGNETKKLAYSVLGFLDEEFRKPTTTADSRESLEVAMQCLETAFGVTIRDVRYKPSKSLREMYQPTSSASATTGVPNGPPFNIPPAFSDLLERARPTGGSRNIQVSLNF